MTINRSMARVLPALVLLATAFAPHTLGGQEPGFAIVPKVGVATPLGTLTDESEMRTALAFGAAAELRLPGLPFSVRANVDHIHDAEIRQRAADELRLGSASITQIVGDVVVRPFTGLVGASPYLLAGAGVRSYSLDVEEDSEFALLRTSFRRFTGHVGGGIDVRLGPVALAAEVADYISTFALPAGGSKLQNDVVGLIGIRVGGF